MDKGVYGMLNERVTWENLIKEVFLPIEKDSICFSTNIQETTASAAFTADIWRGSCIDSKKNARFLRGVLCDTIWGAVLGKILDVADITKPQYSHGEHDCDQTACRERLSSFITGHDTGATLSVTNIFNNNEGYGINSVFEAESSQIEQFLESAVKQTSSQKGKSEEEARKQVLGKFRGNLDTYIQAHKELKERNPVLGSDENIPRTLAAVIMTAILNNQCYRKQLYVNSFDVEKMMDAIWKLQQGKSAALLKQYEESLLEYTSNYYVRDETNWMGSLHKLYVLPKFEKKQDMDADTPVQGENFRSILYGDSGLGKTQFLKLVAFLLVEQDLPTEQADDAEDAQQRRAFAAEQRKALGLAKGIPVLVKAKDLTEEDIAELLETMEENTLSKQKRHSKQERMSNLRQRFFAYAKGMDNFDAEPRNEFCRLLNDRRDVVLLIDGMDEVAPEQLEKFCEIIQGIAGSTSWRILLSSRIDLSPFPNFPQWQMRDFGEESVSALTEKIVVNFLRGNQQRSREIADKILNNRFLKKLAGNPFLVIHITLMLGQNFGSELLPQDVYKRITKLLVEHRMNKFECSENAIHNALAASAWEILEYHSDDCSLPEDQAMTIIETSFQQENINIEPGKIEKFLKLLQHNSGVLLLDEEGSKKEYHFIEQPFLYYYAAKHFAARLQNHIADMDKLGKDYAGCGLRSALGRTDDPCGTRNAYVYDLLKDGTKVRIDSEAKAMVFSMAFSMLTDMVAAHILFDFVLYRAATAQREEYRYLRQILETYRDQTFGKINQSDGRKISAERMARMLEVLLIESENT